MQVGIVPSRYPNLKDLRSIIKMKIGGNLYLP